MTVTQAGRLPHRGAVVTCGHAVGSIALDRTSSGRDRFAITVVAMFLYYLPVVVVSLCNIDLPEVAMAALYLFPLLVLAAGILWLIARSLLSRRIHLVPLPVRV